MEACAWSIGLSWHQCASGGVHAGATWQIPLNRPCSNNILKYNKEKLQAVYLKLYKTKLKKAKSKIKYKS